MTLPFTAPPAPRRSRESALARARSVARARCARFHAAWRASRGRGPRSAWILAPAIGTFALLARKETGIFGQLTGKETVFVIAFLIISLGLHEAAHAWVAWKRGDSTARDLGRLTLNPIAHIDPFLTIILPTVMALTTGFIFGGAKPVPVNPNRLHHPTRDMMLVALAGPLTNLLLALVFIACRNLAIGLGDYQPDQLLVRVLDVSALFNLVLAVFNMLPIPPLDGSRVMTWLLPPALREPYTSLERWGILIVIGVVFFVPPVQYAIGYAIYGLTDWMNRVTWFYG